MATPAQLRVDREVVHRAAMAVVAGHDRGDEAAVFGADEKQLPLHAELARDVLARIVPRPGQLAALPEGGDCRLVVRLERPDPHRYFARAIYASTSRSRSTSCTVTTTSTTRLNSFGVYSS